MKTILLFLLFAITFCYPWKSKPDMTDAPGLTKTSAIAAKDSINFTTQIEPIFQNHCNPCHFPGGKMYERLPFDQAKTILEHKEGIAKRIKDEKDTRMLSLFYAQSGK